MEIQKITGSMACPTTVDVFYNDYLFSFAYYTTAATSARFFKSVFINIEYSVKRRTVDGQFLIISRLRSDKLAACRFNFFGKWGRGLLVGNKVIDLVKIEIHAHKRFAEFGRIAKHCDFG